MDGLGSATLGPGGAVDGLGSATLGTDGFVSSLPGRSDGLITEGFVPD